MKNCSPFCNCSSDVNFDQSPTTDGVVTSDDILLYSIPTMSQYSIPKNSCQSTLTNALRSMIEVSTTKSPQCVIFFHLNFFNTILEARKIKSQLQQLIKLNNEFHIALSTKKLVILSTS